MMEGRLKLLDSQGNLGCLGSLDGDFMLFGEGWKS